MTKTRNEVRRGRTFFFAAEIRRTPAPQTSGTGAPFLLLVFLFEAVAAGILLAVATAAHVNVGERTVFTFHVELAIVDVAADTGIDVLHVPHLLFPFSMRKREKNKRKCRFVKHMRQ